MTLAMISTLGPAITHLPLGLTRGHNILATVVIAIALVLICVAVDFFRSRRLHPAFGWGGALVIGTIVCRRAAGANLRLGGGCALVVDLISPAGRSRLGDELEGHWSGPTQRSGVRPDRAHGATEYEAKEHDLSLVRQRRA